MRKIMRATGLLLFCVMVVGARAATSTFEDLPLGSPATDGSTQYGSTGTYFWNGSNGAGSFSSGGVTFYNSFIDWGGGWTSWDGFAYSNTADTTTASYTNQYSAITGGGVFGSQKYGIGYQPYSGTWSVSLGSAESYVDRGFYATNTTYAYLSMTNGESSFGTSAFSLSNMDYLDLTIEGYNAGVQTGTVTFSLADYRSGPGYTIDAWTFVDLSALGTIDEMRFSMSSSQSTVPTYFAIDNLGAAAVPEPGVLALLVFSAFAVVIHARKRLHAR